MPRGGVAHGGVSAANLTRRVDHGAVVGLNAKRTMSSPSSRLPRRYRVMWNDDGGTASHYHPPLSPERFKQIQLGYLHGYPVDAYLYPLCFSGYTTTFPSRSRAYTFIVDRLQQVQNFGGHKGLRQYRFVDNFRRLWEAGHDPTELLMQESERLDIDFWLHLRMNDWHHWGAVEEDPDRPGLPANLNLYSSPFYEEHPEYLIGADGVAGYQGDSPPRAMPYLQDFAHEEVRDSRIEVMVEACERYDVAGFHYDFMRIPGYFKIGQEQANAPLMTDLIRRSRSELDRIGQARGKHIGFAVRVPSTIAGAQGIGLDVPTWIQEGLVDLVIPSCFFCTDFGADMTEWVELARAEPVRIYAGIEEAYRAGHTGHLDVSALDYGTQPKRLLLDDEMISACAANHWASGVDGIYTFNWHCKTWEGNRLNLDNLGDAQRLEFRDKLYAVTRRDGQYQYCDLQAGPLPARLGPEQLVLDMRVADDLTSAADRLESCRLWLHLIDFDVTDRIEVTLNGVELACANPLIPGQMETPVWLRYEPAPELVNQGANEVGIRLLSRDIPLQVQEEAPIDVADVELEIRYLFPDGKGSEPRGYRPRT